MSLESQSFILECLMILVFFGFGRLLGIFAIGILGRAIVLLLVYAVLASLNPNLIYYWAGAASIIMFIVGAFWRDRNIVISLYYRIINLFNGLRYQIDFSRSEKKAYKQAQSDYEAEAKRANEYGEKFQQSQSEYEQAKQRAEQAEQYYKQKAQQAEKKAGKNKQQDTSSSERKLDPNNLNDAYEILGVEQGASKEECKLAYKRLSNIYHPDKVNKFTGWRKEQAEDDMKLINRAWVTIQKKKS